MSKRDLILEPFDSERWTRYVGTFGNMSDAVRTLINDPDNKDNAENVYQGINHQMSFYPAAYIVIPYFAGLLEGKIKSGDVEWVEYCLFNIAMTIASDNRRGRIIEKGKEATKDIMKNYKCTVRGIKKTARQFYRKNRKKLTHKSESGAAKLVFHGFGALVYMVVGGM